MTNNNIYHFDDFEDINMSDNSKYMKLHIKHMILLYKFGKKHNLNTKNQKTLHKMIKEHFPEMLFE